MGQQRVRVQNFTVTEDGYGSGRGQSAEAPFGDLDVGRLMSWVGGTASWTYRDGPGGSRGLDDLFVRDFEHGIGVEVMGRNKFGPVRGPWPDEEWRGWWGDEPPFHAPVVVMTHHPRPSFTLADTTFHFRSGEPADVLAEARELAGGLDVRIGGGVATVRAFLDAGLVDDLHVVVAPLTAGGGEWLWESPADLEDRYEHEAVPSPSGVVHHLFWR
ncbi:MAG: deaminase [Nocardioides sp.]|nr:deaminase [Nocardioides sp.]